MTRHGDYRGRGSAMTWPDGDPYPGWSAESSQAEAEWLGVRLRLALTDGSLDEVYVLACAAFHAAVESQRKPSVTERDEESPF